MSRMVLVALHLAWCAVRGDDYSGGVMPQYGSLGSDYEAPRGDDYRGHSHDAPAPLDYKYEEEAHGDTEKPSKYVDEVERWRRPVRKHRQQRQDSEEHDRDLDSESEETPKSRLNHHQSRRKERVRAESSRRDGGRRGFRRGKHVDNEPDYSESNDYRGEANKYRDDEDHVRLKATTARVIRRKPRDRMYVPAAPADAKTLLPMDEEEAAGSPVRKEEWNDNIENAPFPVRNMAPGPGTDRRAPGNLDLDLESDDGAKPRMKSKYRNYQDYGDYYDMKRVSNIQNKLPSLLRRTTTLSVTHTGAADLVQALWPSRRAGTTATVRLDPPIYFTTVAAAFTASLESETIVPRNTRVLQTAEITTVAPPPMIQSPAKNLTELSIAEKSRLSIMKKSQMKESVKVGTTKKPPVLLQVRSKPVTMVMVEPGTTENPWMRAREVADDTPETLDKVKQMMRLKLVANAKDIRELTDDWDKLICDYVDMSMLQSVSLRAMYCTRLVFSLALMLLFIL